MSARKFGLAAVTLCFIGGLIAAIFTPAIAATLTLSRPGLQPRPRLSPRFRPMESLFWPGIPSGAPTSRSGALHPMTGPGAAMPISTRPSRL